MDINEYKRIKQEIKNLKVFYNVRKCKGSGCNQTGQAQYNSGYCSYCNGRNGY